MKLRFISACVVCAGLALHARADSVVVFNEIMYHPAVNEAELEYVELYNTFCYEIDITRWEIRGGIDFRFPDGTIVPPTGCVVVALSPSELQTESGYAGAYGPFLGRLANNGEQLRLYNNNDRLMDEVDYGVEGDWPVAPDGSGVSLVKIDPEASSAPAESWGWSGQVGGSPGAVNNAYVSEGRVINEIASAASTNFFAELHHHGTNVPAPPINHVLVSDGTVTGQYVFSQAQLGPGTYLAINEATLGFHPLDEDRLYLYQDETKTVVIDAAVVKISHRGRFPEGTGRLLYPHAETPGAANSFMFRDEIVINEIMYRMSPQYEPFIDDPEEWIELFNRSATNIDLSGWRMAGGIDFVFPQGTTINTGDFLVVAKDAATLAAKYPAITIIGNFDQTLSNADELIRLEDANRNPADEVHYYDEAPWPMFADGGGSSLELRDPDADNSIAEAWADSDQLATSPWQSYSFTNTAVPTHAPVIPSGNVPDTFWHELVLGMLNAGVVLLDDVSVIESPTGAAIEFIQNGSFESDAVGSIPDKWRLRGNHRHVRVIVDPHDAGNQVLRLFAKGPTTTAHNDAETTYANGETVVYGNAYEISFKAKWINGCRRLHARLYHSVVARETILDASTLSGTPGAVNSAFATNIGPTYTEFIHSPAVPAVSQAVTLSAKADDPDGVTSMTAWYSVDEGAWTSIAMSNQGNGLHTASIPGQAASSIVQFYVEGQDTLGAVSTYPHNGVDSRALFKVEDGQAATNGLHNFRIIMTTSDTDWLHEEINGMSNDRLGGTVVYNEQEIFYNVGVRLRGSSAGRFRTTLGHNVHFPADNRFRGIQRGVALDRDEDGLHGQREMLQYIASARAGTLATKYTDLVKVLSPRPEHTVTAELRLARWSDDFFDSQFENGSDGNLFKYETLPWSINTDSMLPEGNKRRPSNFSLTAVVDIGNDKEDYRYYFLNKNNRNRDDYSGLIRLCQTLDLNNPALNQQVGDIIDVDMFLREFAHGTYAGARDTWTFALDFPGGAQHDAMFYERPSDKKLLYFPHDVDGGWIANVATTPIIGNPKVAEMLESPTHEQLYLGHMYDILTTAYNTAYMSRWTDQFGVLLTPQPFASHLSYIGTRHSNLMGEINDMVMSQYPFIVTTAGGPVASTTATIDGEGWIDVHQIWLDGIDEPLQLTWTKTGSGSGTKFFWHTTVPLNPGPNDLLFAAYDFQGDLLASNTITITSTIAERPLRDNLRVTELMYNPAIDGDDEFIELSNIGTSVLDLTHVTFANGVDFAFQGSSVTNLSPGEYIVITRDVVAFEARYGTSGITLAGEYSGSLANGGETFDILGQYSADIVAVTFDDTRGWPLSPDGAGHSLVPLALADQSLGALEYGGNWRASAYIHGSPGRVDPMPVTDVVLNELKAHTDTGQPAPFDSDDWIELYNAGPSAVTLTNWYLSDDCADLRKSPIWATDVISAGGWQAYTENIDFHSNRVDGFGLDKAAEQVFLSYLPGNTNDRVADAVAFKGQEIADSLGRYPDADPYWYALSPTFDAANSAPSSHVVITEIMYNPGPTNALENTLEEFIEICNATPELITLENATGPWRLDGLNYTFPPNTLISPSECILIVSFDPTNAATLNAFTTAYGLETNSVRILGPYSGQLANAGERIALERPQAPDPPSGVTSWVIVDELIYFHRDPWAGTAAGTGLSLHRIDRDVSGNDPNNWQADLPSPESAQSKVAIVRPIQNADIPTPFSTSVEIFVDMTQVTGAVQQVEVFDGMNSLGVDLTAPYKINWNELLTNREVFLRAELTDGSGTTTSSVVRVTTWMLDHQQQVSMLTDYSARMSGTLTGEGSAQASFFYGTSDGGMDQGAWASRFEAGQIGQGAFSVDINDLLIGETYFFRAYATNDFGDTWSGAASMFNTPTFAQWDRRMNITFSGYSDAETLTNFPALVVLSTNIPGFLYSQFGSPSGADLRFAAGTIPLNYEIENWDPAGESHVWVQVPIISGPSDFVSAHWGQTNATVPPPYTQNGSTWAEGYELVLHLNGDVSDSTPGAVYVADLYTTDTAGIVANARDFDSTTNSYLEPVIDPDWYGDNISNLTVSVWGRPDSTTPKSPFGVHGIASDSINIKPSRGMWSYRVANNAKNGSPIQATQWQMLGIVLNGNTSLGYHNETQHNIGAYTGFVPPDRLRFGDNKGESLFFDGYLDEARISRVARSPAWMRASYRTVAQNQTFLSYLIVTNEVCPYSVEYCEYIGPYPVADNDPDTDSDGDGATNFEEFIAGTDPTDPNDVFQVLEIELLSGSNCVLWMSGTNSGISTDFMLMRMTNLVDFVFEEIANGIVRDPSGMNVFYDTNPPTAPAYYRPALPTNAP